MVAVPPPGPVTASYIWCDTRLCQARNASNATTREYFPEGEFVPGSPPQPYYYGPDQIGSVRRAFASATSAPAYGYDPYGNALQPTAPVTDFGYADMFYSADSGLYLTLYRAYDPVPGRWLSRDPLGEMAGQVDSIISKSSVFGYKWTTLPTNNNSSRTGAANNRIKLDLGINAFTISTNLYTYVKNNPVSRWDLLGLCDSNPPPSDQPPIQDVNWVRRCILALAICSGMNNPFTAGEPTILDIPIEPKPPIITRGR
jgi:RHS repeat-associated protein